VKKSNAVYHPPSVTKDRAVTFIGQTALSAITPPP